MKVDILLQNEENNLIKEFEKSSNVSKVYIFSSSIKENSIDFLYNFEKSKLCIYMGIDKKNTTKKLLDTILEFTNELYVYDNNNLKEFVAGICILESKESSTVYITNGSFSEAKLTNDFSVITKITYDLSDKEDKKLYKLKLKELLNIKDDGFVKIGLDDIDDLINKKKIFSNRQYVHKVKSISDYIGEAKKEKEKDVPKSEMLEVNLDDDIDIDFDISMDEEIIHDNESEIVLEEEKIEEKEEVEEVSNEVFDLDNILLEKADIKLEVNEDEEKVEEKETKNKNVDLNNVSNYIFQLASKQKNKKDKDMIKIPNYINNLAPNLFTIDNGENREIEGVNYKVLDIQLDIIDAKNNKKYKDENAKIMLKKGQTYFFFKSEKIENIEYEEEDIARIIKLSNKNYHVEIVSKDLEEYKIWNKITNIKFKGNTSRMYGVM